METANQHQTPPPAKLDDFDVEIYKTHASVTQFRVGLQNKCIEMSLHITMGLAGAVAAAAIAWITRTNSSSSDPVTIRCLMFIVFYLYGLIQLLILTNYIYQTYMLQGFGYIYNDVTVRSFRKVLSFSGRDELPNAGQVEGKQARRDPNRFVGKLQPLILYVSTVLGGLLALVSILMSILLWPLSCWAIVISIVIFLFWSLLVWCIYKLHKRVHEPDTWKVVVDMLLNQPVHDVECATRQEGTDQPP